MIFYRPSEDWITHLEGNALADLLKTLRGLSLEQLHKYPPPKVAGLPPRNESREFLHFLKDESSQLDASALSPLYRSFVSGREKFLYRAFRQNLPLNEWEEIIGADNVEM